MQMNTGKLILWLLPWSGRCTVRCHGTHTPPPRLGEKYLIVMAVKLKEIHMNRPISRFVSPQPHEENPTSASALDGTGWNSHLPWNYVIGR